MDNIYILINYVGDNFFPLTTSIAIIVLVVVVPISIITNVVGKQFNKHPVSENSIFIAGIAMILFISVFIYALARMFGG